MCLSPKVELHLHLDCSLSFNAVVRLNPLLTREEFEADFVAPKRCTNLADFLTRAPRGFELMQTKDALLICTEDLFEQLAADNVIYAEIRFAPLLHVQNGPTSSAVVDALNRATEECIRFSGIEARLILCTLRHFSEEQSMETARLAVDFMGSNVVALDLAGDETGFAIDSHIRADRFACEAGIHRTAHAGEAAGPESLRKTLHLLGPERIGHGIRCVEDPSLVKYLRGRQLEVCPTSNVQTCACPDYTRHPVKQMLDAGLSLSISTDARTISNVTLAEEYQHRTNVSAGRSPSSNSAISPL